MPDTIRTLSFLLNQVLQNGQAQGAIDEQDIRDVVVSLAQPEAILTWNANMTWNMDTQPVAYVRINGPTNITVVGNGPTFGGRLAIAQPAGAVHTVNLAGLRLLATPVWSTTPNGLNTVEVDVINGERCAMVSP